MSRLKILLWTKHPGDLLGEAIDFITHGNAQHAAFRDIDGSVVEAYWPRLRRRELLDVEKQFILAFTLKSIAPEQELQISKGLALDLTHPPDYSGWDLIRFLFNQPDASETATFCSRYVQHTCETNLPQSMWPQVRLMDNDWASPRDLLISNLLEPCDLDE